MGKKIVQAPEKAMRTCISPEGMFVYGIHKPSYTVRNLRSRTKVEKLGCDEQGLPVDNSVNYPQGIVEVPEADWIYEIANPFPFRGTTYIGRDWADRSAADYGRIMLVAPGEVSLTGTLAAQGIGSELLKSLPRPVMLSLATTSTDPKDLTVLAELSCSFEKDRTGKISGLKYSNNKGRTRPVLKDHILFEAVANNPALPDDYKIAMVIRPGAQGASEIVGDYHLESGTHVYEYLRRNSYIGGGHYAANMADDAIRYSIKDLGDDDILGLRHLYYQRTYCRLADQAGIEIKNSFLTDEELEEIRIRLTTLSLNEDTGLAATLWGWNFGFDYAPSGYRLHASHQQIHQQYSMIPDSVESFSTNPETPIDKRSSFSSGDMVEEVIEQYRQWCGASFFRDYIKALENNTRMDSRPDRERSLVVWEDENVLLFVPKAQTSQWELQLMTKPKKNLWPGNLVETDLATRKSLDTGILKAQKCLAGRGAKMVTSIEYSKRFGKKKLEQPLIYCLMPKLPESPGAFSETQLRFINGHYPEDFAAVCRKEEKGLSTEC